MPERILFAALGRMDRLGHARFTKGEIARIVSQVDPATGEITTARADSLSKAISKAKETGYIGHDSRARCITIPHTTAQMEKGAKIICPVHS
jgi:hypothetical protein